MRNFFNLFTLSMLILGATNTWAYGKTENKPILTCDSVTTLKKDQVYRLIIFSRPNGRGLECEENVYADIKKVVDGVALFEQRYQLYNFTASNQQYETFYGDGISINVRFADPKNKKALVNGTIVAQMENGPTLKKDLRCQWHNEKPQSGPVRDSELPPRVWPPYDDYNYFQ